jgi:transcriptional regulator with XRE-family HTH domain
MEADGSRCRRRRELVGMTLDQLAQLTGISKAALSKHETNVETLLPPRQALVEQALARALGAHAPLVADELDLIKILPESFVPRG